MLTRPRYDLQEFQVVSGAVWLAVYRRDDELVRGVCMSLSAGALEVLRWDLQPGIAHVHWAVGRRSRLYMPRDWPAGRLHELACSQLVEHTPVVWRLARAPGRRPPRDRLEAAALWAAPRLAAGGG